MARRSGSRINFYVDFEPIIDFIGAGEALTEVLQSPTYQNRTFNVAFAESEEKFNLLAAALGAAGDLRHMFEWGTAGVNQGRSNMRQNPLSEKARLWNTRAIGEGYNRTISYDFKPSIAFVPRPTTKNTYMKSEDIEQLNPEQIFTWKAQAFEWGSTIIARPKMADALIIPIERGESATKAQKKRGYRVSRKPVVFEAGGNQFKGNFTKFFEGFWQTEGIDIINESLQRQIESDFNKVTRSISTRGQMTLPGLSITSRLEESRASMIRIFEKTAAARERAVENAE